MELLQKMLPSILCEIVRFRFLNLKEAARSSAANLLSGSNLLPSCRG